jgi:hypothetical protein
MTISEGSKTRGASSCLSLGTAGRGDVFWREIVCRFALSLQPTVIANVSVQGIALIPLPTTPFVGVHQVFAGKTKAQNGGVL